MVACMPHIPGRRLCVLYQIPKAGIGEELRGGWHAIGKAGYLRVHGSRTGAQWDPCAGVMGAVPSVLEAITWRESSYIQASPFWHTVLMRSKCSN